MADIFISYKRENLAPVQRAIEGLREAGLSVWWDQDIPPDAPWEATIERELEAAKVVIVAWSRAAAASENVKAEARRARTQGKLIQIFVEPCDPPLFFGERQGVDLSGWNGASTDHRFQTVVIAARAIMSGRRPPEGVGYRPRKRAPWGVLTALFVGVSAALGFVANLGGARDTLCSFGLPGSICPAAGPQTSDGPSRAALLDSMNGVWTNTHSEPLCASTMTLAVARGEDGLDRLRVRADPDFDVTLQVVAVDTESRIVTAQDADGGTDFRYRVVGNSMELTEPPRQGEARPRITPLTRCD